MIRFVYWCCNIECMLFVSVVYVQLRQMKCVEMQVVGTTKISLYKLTMRYISDRQNKSIYKFQTNKDGIILLNYSICSVAIWWE